MEWSNRKEFRQFMGWDYPMDENALEDLLVEYDFEVELDEDGKVEWIEANPDKMKAALFDQHNRDMGYRPDDIYAAANAHHGAALEENERREKRAVMKKRLHTRVKARRTRNARA